MTTTQNHKQPVVSVSTPAEVTACALHNLGYWPEKSIMVMTAGGARMGPVLRANVPTFDLPAEEIEEMICQLVSNSPQKFSPAEPITTFFLLIFGADTGIRSRQLNPHTHRQPEHAQIEAEAEQAADFLPWISGAFQAARTLRLNLGDIFYIGEVSRWELSQQKPEFELSGFVEDIQKTNVYLTLMTEGSVVASNRSEHVPQDCLRSEATLDTELQEGWLREATFWFDQFQHHIEIEDDYCADYLRQKYAEAALWSLAVDVTRQELSKPLKGKENKNRNAVLADRLRSAIPEQLAGFLSATLTSVSSMQFALFTAADSIDTCRALMAHLHREQAREQPQAEAPASSHLLLPTTIFQGGIFEEKAQQLAADEIDFPSVEEDEMDEACFRFGELLTGRTDTAPQWERIVALQNLVELLVPCAYGMELGRLKLMLAWIAWLKGSCSLAAQYLDECRNLGIWEGTPLDMVVECGLLPQWVTDGERCFRGIDFAEQQDS